MKVIVRAAAVLSLAAALGGCASPQPTPVLTPAPVAATQAPAARLTTVQAHHASAPKTALIALGIAAAAVVIIIIANSSGGTGY